jgi:hypothetical protein
VAGRALLSQQVEETSPLSWKVGIGSSRATAPFGSGWPLGRGTPGVVATGAIANVTASRVGWSPFGNSVPLCVPERWAMMDDFTFAAMVLWQVPHVCSTIRRSLGLAHMPAWAVAASDALPSPRWHRVQVSGFFGWASSIPRWHVTQPASGFGAGAP